MVDDGWMMAKLLWW